MNPNVPSCVAITRPPASTTSPSRTSCGAVERTNAPASPEGAKQSSWESGFDATGSPNRSACARVSVFDIPPTGNSDRESCR